MAAMTMDGTGLENYIQASGETVDEKSDVEHQHMSLESPQNTLECLDQT